MDLKNESHYCVTTYQKTGVNKKDLIFETMHDFIWENVNILTPEEYEPFRWHHKFFKEGEYKELVKDPFNLEL